MFHLPVECPQPQTTFAQQTGFNVNPNFGGTMLYIHVDKYDNIQISRSARVLGDLIGMNGCSIRYHLRKANVFRKDGWMLMRFDEGDIVGTPLRNKYGFKGDQYKEKHGEVYFD